MRPLGWALIQQDRCPLRREDLGSSLAVQWLGLSTFTAVTRFRELRSCKPCVRPEKKKKGRQAERKDEVKRRKGKMAVYKPRRKA